MILPQGAWLGKTENSGTHHSQLLCSLHLSYFDSLTVDSASA
jgi:hypothetical protein